MRANQQHTQAHIHNSHGTLTRTRGGMLARSRTLPLPQGGVFGVSMSNCRASASLSTCPSSRRASQVRSVRASRCPPRAFPGACFFRSTSCVVTSGEAKSESRMDGHLSPWREGWNDSHR